MIQVDNFSDFEKEIVKEAILNTLQSSANRNKLAKYILEQFKSSDYFIQAGLDLQHTFFSKQPEQFCDILNDYTQDLGYGWNYETDRDFSDVVFYAYPPVIHSSEIYTILVKYWKEDHDGQEPNTDSSEFYSYADTFIESLYTLLQETYEGIQRNTTTIKHFFPFTKGYASDEIYSGFIFKTNTVLFILDDKTYYTMVRDILEDDEILEMIASKVADYYDPNSRNIIVDTKTLTCNISDHVWEGVIDSLLSEDELYSLREVAPDVFNIHPDLVNDIRYCLQQASSLI